MSTEKKLKIIINPMSENPIEIEGDTMQVFIQDENNPDDYVDVRMHALGWMKTLERKDHQ